MSVGDVSPGRISGQGEWRIEEERGRQGKLKFNERECEITTLKGALLSRNTASGPEDIKGIVEHLNKSAKGIAPNQTLTIQLANGKRFEITTVKTNVESKPEEVVSTKTKTEGVMQKLRDVVTTIGDKFREGKAAIKDKIGASRTSEYISVDSSVKTSRPSLQTWAKDKQIQRADKKVQTAIQKLSECRDAGKSHLLQNVLEKKLNLAVAQRDLAKADVTAREKAKQNVSKCKSEVNIVQKELAEAKKNVGKWVELKPWDQPRDHKGTYLGKGDYY